MGSSQITVFSMLEDDNSRYGRCRLLLGPLTHPSFYPPGSASTSPKGSPETHTDPPTHRSRSRSKNTGPLICPRYKANLRPKSPRLLNSGFLATDSEQLDLEHQISAIPTDRVGRDPGF
jgi:hypothetical protein